jgi:c-di-GMP-binding flagellar brake protein YcgR
MDKWIEGRNRRKSKRIDAVFTLSYSVENPHSLRISLGLVDDIDALMVNLSDSGMGIITKHDLPLGTELYIKFNIIDLRLTGDERRRHMAITGEVVSNDTLPGQGQGHRIGIRFIKITSEDKIAISDFINRRS